ncbi:AsmA family protein [Stenotrophomonas sp. SAU14A_NAIMI4_8]|uniref:AsmA family protein n=1 Tax=Stenotrophomonas sp. SAU14A_NAIMI4_8 TaxID=2072409 RepID=UPI000D541502|nr:AsmA family protein [Stenotrophomonas sp. SAU14A_NAIMI4_8]AWH34083.1 AsmA family protein [Stenotrophomonas sp. SAU14A_NAIMI4_8]
MNAAPSPATPRASRWRLRRPGRRGQRWLAALVFVLAAILVLIALWDWNWFKGPVERAVQARTGRALHIGNLDVDLGRVTTVRADTISFANATWAKQPNMASADRVEIDVRVWPLLRGSVQLPEVRLTRPDVLLQTAPREGEAGNWDFLGDSSGGTTPQLKRLFIDDGRLQFSDARGRTDIRLNVRSGQPRQGDAAPPLRVAGKGRWQGNAFTLSGGTESPLQLTDSAHPFRIHLDGRAGGTHAVASGTLTNPFALQLFDLHFALSGQDLADLYPLLGIAIPPSPPYALNGRLKRDHNVWRYERFTGKVGDSDLGGNLQFEVGRDRPRLTATLESRRLDFDDLAGFVGAPPRTGSGETANAEQKAEAAQVAASSRVLPDTPYNLGKLRAMDADVRWKAHRINAPSLPLDDMDAHLLLDDGVLRLDPLNFGVAGGDIRSTIRMDARQPQIATSLKASVRGVQLGQLFPDAKLAEQAKGGISGQIDLSGRGNSIAAMLGGSSGDVGVAMGRGHVGNLVMELAGLDITESVKFLFTGDRQIPLRCAFADFGVRDGVMTSRALAVDTTDTIVIGEGTVNLRDESLDLLLRPRPKDKSILVLRSPLRIGGTFKDPSFRPDFKALGLRGAVALALGSIAPPAALLATIETGPGKDANCGGQYAK